MRLPITIIALTLSVVCSAQRHLELNLPTWQFSHDGHQWQTVDVSHDWAISGPFDKKWELQTVAIEQNGEKEKTEKSGRSGARPWIGKGQYQTTLSVPKGYKHAVLVFDGAMAEPTVTVNGHEAGYWAYGYNAFRLDVTPYLYMNGRENTIHVGLQNVEESSRWYPGDWVESRTESGDESVGADAMYYHDMTSGYDWAEPFYATQTLFNTDEDFEYIQPVYSSPTESWRSENDRDGDGEMTRYLLTTRHPLKG